MTSQNQSGKDAKTLNTPKDDTAPKATETPEVTRELTDDEIAAVAGGGLTIVTRPPGRIVTGG
jgi:hypothetical protein